MPVSLALVGATGGAGTTRTAVELAAVLGREGRDVVVLDAAFATQGLADHVEGRVAPDVTSLCLDDRPLSEGLLALDWPVEGHVAVAPARAPFERIARAKGPEPARAIARLAAEAANRADVVLLDVPPVAANQAVAALETADRVALVVPDTERGSVALPRMRDRLTDLGRPADAVVATCGPGDHVPADAAIPATDARAPAVLEEDGFAADCAGTAGTLLEVDLVVDDESLLGFL